jgi:glutamyl-tRNA(Gln) amidotransferase subunit D
LIFGYNIGVAYSNDSKIKRLGVGTKGIKFPRKEVTTKRGLPKVTLIYTGGTIGSKIDYKTGGVHMLIEPAELLYEVPELSEIANIEVRHILSIASEDMSYLEWQRIAKEVERALNGGSRGVVITMGTDTMHYTAAALSFMLHDLNAPVIITGAQRSSDRGSSDAFMNLTCAVQLAAKSDVAEVGICMHLASDDSRCSLIRGTRARKMHTSRRDAFRPINDRPIAIVDRQLNIIYTNHYNKIIQEMDDKMNAQINFEGKVALVKSYPNSDPEIIDFYVKKGYKGIIIEGTGLGHVPTSTEHSGFLWLDQIKKAINKGVIVGMTSQCLYGRVNKNVYRNLRLTSRLGVVYCEDMLPETAYIKLGWLLANYDVDEAKKILNKNMRGEIKKRSRIGEFLA